ncbi:MULTISPECIES: carboxylesterase/lipase family protein [unclassified Streptomyces]|uniref:carboxylesterase/lipase family protein n=1 Tax=unclassified Streptomyces TaxID=2593676 RepID=UPI0037FA8A73
MNQADDLFHVEDGAVRGHRPVPGVVACLGIPYAAAPFGAGRFREPRPPSRWAGVREGGAFGPVVPQSARLPGAPFWTPGEEDVLTLNVWAPEPGPASGAAPVLVWIHGGAYTFGSSAQPDFDGAELARTGGLVVVTVNYRLGFEGFGRVPDAPGCPDNRGLLDQLAALRWVRTNIAAFGGDPGNVTVAGQSSGAASAVCLMGMARARGLFRRVVALSPASPCRTAGLAAATTREVAAAAGVAATAEGLAAASPSELVDASDRVVERYRRDPDTGARHHNPVIYGPVVDGEILPAAPLAAIEAGAAREVELLVCHTTQEYWLMDAVGATDGVGTDERLAALARDLGLPAYLVPGYRALLPEATAHEIQLSVLGDLLFAEYANRLAETHARAGGRTYLSRFDRRRTGPRGPVLAWHNADVPFVFGTLGDPAVAFLVGGPPTADDHRLARRMRASLAAFAATGDPGWPPLGEAAAHVWGAAESTGTAWHPGTRELWRDVDFVPLSTGPAG